MTQCWDRDQHKRPGFAEILERLQVMVRTIKETRGELRVRRAVHSRRLLEQEADEMKVGSMLRTIEDMDEGWCHPVEVVGGVANGVAPAGAGAAAAKDKSRSDNNSSSGGGGAAAAAAAAAAGDADNGSKSAQGSGGREATRVSRAPSFGDDFLGSGYL